MATVRQFLETLFPDLIGGFVETRAIHPLNHATQSHFYPSLEALFAEQVGIDTLAKQFHVYFGVCPRNRREGTKDAVRLVWCLWADVDAKLFPGGKAEALKRLREFPLPPTAIVDSGHGFHLYWRLKEPEEITGPEDVARLEAYLKALTHALGADPSAAELARILRLPGTLNLKDPSAPLPVTVVELEPDRQYNLSDFEAFLNIPAGQPNALNKPGWIAEVLSGLTEGNRNSTFAKVIGRLHHDGWETQDILTLLTPHAQEHNFSLEELRKEVEGICARYPQSEEPSTGTAKKLSAYHWPDPPDQAALHGLAGDFVRLIGPNTEADPAALLIQFLVAFGNAVGRGPYFQHEATKHHFNLFVVLVGASSRSRKGTSLRHVLELFQRIDADWASKRVYPGGLASGEGLIWSVRDPIEKRVPIKKNGRHTGEYENVIEDFGIDDKRILVIEEEFSSPLQVMKREGNTLSPMIRCAWDRGELELLTKNSPARATGAHISIIGHITQYELLRHFDNTEAANGFGNRILWMCVKRDKLLPDGGCLPEEDFADLALRVGEALEFGRKAGKLRRDEEAREIWHTVYPHLTRDNPGLLGAVVSRAEAQVLRLSCLYALLDLSFVIKAIHLKAALALWEFAEQSARYIFGDSLGYPEADVILQALRAEAKGLTRTQIQNLFQRNKTAEQIYQALEFLEKNQFARRVSERTEGRPAERWLAI